MEILHKLLMMKLVLQLIEELPIKNKTVRSVGAPQREKVLFYNIHFFWEIFFIIRAFFQNIAYWINFMISYLNAATQPLNTQNVTKTLYPNSLN